MALEINEIEKQALALAPQDRALLIRQLIRSLDQEKDDIDSDRMWVEESNRRYDRYKQGKTIGKPADQVLRDARAKLE